MRASARPDERADRGQATCPADDELLHIAGELRVEGSAQADPAFRRFREERNRVGQLESGSQERRKRGSEFGSQKSRKQIRPVFFPAFILTRSRPFTLRLPAAV